MVDHAIKGSSVLHRLSPAPDGGSGLLVARFLVRASGGDAEHNTGLLLDDGNVPIVWDTTPEKDDIGFPSDYHTTGGLFTADEADYHIDAYAEIDPVSAFTGGAMLVSIETGGSLVNSSQLCLNIAGTTPRASVSVTHHFAGGYFGSFEVHVHAYGLGDNATVTRASLDITKLN